ncbi:MAG: DUF5915 domain-containing protein, partial [Candidatus Nanohaloarchaea archaeon]
EFSRGAVYLDTERTEELVDEAFANEVVRAVQQARKEADLEVDDSVKLSFSGDTEPLEEFEDRIRSRVNVTEINYDGEELSHAGEVELEGREAQFSFSEPR